jgi:hypothetical protein
MSYDISIEHDSAKSVLVNVDEVRVFLRQVPGMIENDAIQFTYEPDEQHYMELDFERYDVNGEWIEDDAPTHINCISVHIPYGYMSAEAAVPNPYLTICVALAAHLGWEARDLQTGQDLTQGIDHERIRQIATGVMGTMTQFFDDKTTE